MLLSVSYDSSNQPTFFEVSNAVFGRRDVCRVFNKIPGAKCIRRNLRQDVFCEYELNGIRFVAEEPWGDNSVYGIYPVSPGFTPEFEIIRQAFADAKPTLWGYIPWVVLAAGLAASFFTWSTSCP
jgi:hypothetical protein